MVKVVLCFIESPELSRFQDFHNYEHYKDMQPDTNQPARLYGTAKTRKSEH